MKQLTSIANLSPAAIKILQRKAPTESKRRPAAPPKSEIVRRKPLLGTVVDVGAEDAPDDMALGPPVPPSPRKRRGLLEWVAAALGLVDNGERH